jgi:hypothetical protein
MAVPRENMSQIQNGFPGLILVRVADAVRGLLLVVHNRIRSECGRVH